MKSWMMVVVSALTCTTAYADETAGLTEPNCVVNEESRHSNPAIYPASLVQTRLVGTTILRINLDSQGKINSKQVLSLDTLPVRVEKSSRNRDFDRAAMEAARKWSYVCSKAPSSSVNWARVEVSFAAPAEIENATTATDVRTGKAITENTLFDLSFSPDVILRDDSYLKFDSAEAAIAHIESIHNITKITRVDGSSSYIHFNPEKSVFRDSWWVVSSKNPAAPSVYRIRDSIDNTGRTARMFSVVCGADRLGCELLDYAINMEVKLQSKRNSKSNLESKDRLDP